MIANGDNHDPNRIDPRKAPLRPPPRRVRRRDHLLDPGGALPGAGDSFAVGAGLTLRGHDLQNGGVDHPRVRRGGLRREFMTKGIRALLESRAPGRYWVAELEGRVVGQLLITFEWSDWRNRMVWWIQSVYVMPNVRGRGVLRTLYDATRREALASGSGGLRLYVDTTNVRAQRVYAALGMRGDHYRVFEEMFAEPLSSADILDR